MDASLPCLTHDDYTVALICPMGVELAPVRAMLDEEHQALPLKRDLNSYTLGRMGVHNVAIAVMPEIGTNKAATVATQLLNDFESIRFGLLVGIGGGIPDEDGNDIRLGDVVVSKPTSEFGGVVQFDMGKVHPNGRFERTGSLNKPPAVLMANVHKLEAEHRIHGNKITQYLSDMLDRFPAMEDGYICPGVGQDRLFEANYNHTGGATCGQCDQGRIIERVARRKTTPRIHYGTIGSANEVIKDSQTRDRLRKDLGILCVEMEAAGLMDEFSCLVIRGICDYADSHKNKRWQPYAAATAAAYAKELLSIIPAQEIKKTSKAADAFEKLREQDRLLGKLPHDKRVVFNSYNNQHDPLCLPDTRVDVLKHIIHWADGCDGKGIFWLKGMAGTGKSTIARTIARKYHDENRLGASFFFSKREDYLSKAGRFFTSVAVQLASSSTAVKNGVCDAIAKRSDIADLAFRDQWTQLILKPLSELKVGSSQPPFVLVIDALDECENVNDIRAILLLLQEARELKTLRLRIFMTSRPETGIREGFDQILGTGYHDLVLHNISSPIINHDISTFFKHNLGIIRRNRAFPADWPGDQTIENLVCSAGGLFIWADTACRFIGGGGPLTKSRLSTVLKGDPTKGPEGKLNEIYNTILENSVRGDYDEMERTELLQILNGILGTIVILFSSIPITSLERLLYITKEDLCQMLGGLHSVLGVPNDMKYPIRLHHPSFRDFILDKQRCNERFWVDEKKAHESLAKSCLELLSQNLRRNICDLGSLGTLATEVDSCRVEQRIPADIQYACRYWVQHIRRSEAHLSDGCQVHQFLRDHFLHWLEALSLTSKMAEGCNMITDLSKHLSALQLNKNAELPSLVHDAQRFTLKHRSVIEVAPLQVYSSALLFSPTSSVVKELFSDRVPRWIKSMPAVEDNWGALLQTIQGHSRSVYVAAFSPDGKLFASASSDNTVKLWDSDTGAPRGTFEGHSDVVRAVAFSPNGQLLASASADKSIMLWDPSTGKLRSTLEGHSDWVRAVVFSPDGKRLASASSDRTVKLWDLETETVCGTFGNHLNWVKTVIFSPDGRLLVSTSSKTIQLWDLKSDTSYATFEGHSNWVKAVVFSPDGQILASGSYDKTVKFWNVKERKSYRTLEGHSDGVRAVVFSPDGQHLASGSTDKTIKLWEVKTGALRGTFEGHSGWVRALDFSPDGQLLISASSDMTVKLWDPRIETTKPETTPCALKGHSDGVWTMTHSPDGQHLASASFDGSVKLWDLRTGAFGADLIGHSMPVCAVAFSPNSQILASASSDKTIKLWDVDTRMCSTLEGHSGAVTAVAFSPDGRLLASISSDNTARLWNPETKEMLQVLWLPVGHQPMCLSILDNVLVMGYMSGRLTFIEFDATVLTDFGASGAGLDDQSLVPATELGQFQSETAEGRSLKRKHSFN